MSEPQQCQGMNVRRYYWGVDVICPTEPDYVPGKGILLESYTPCRNVASAGDLFCPKHNLWDDACQVMPERRIGPEFHAENVTHWAMPTNDSE